MNPWVILVVLAALAVGGVKCYQAGAADATKAYEAALLKTERQAHDNYVAGVKRAIEQADQIAAQNAEADSSSVKRRAHIETVFQKIDHEVIRYVQTDAGRGLCFDDDGLRLYNAANRGELPATDNAAPGGSGHGAVPGSTDSGERQPGRDTANEQDDGAGISPLQGQATVADGLGEAQP